MAEPTKTCVIYCRYSSEAQRNSLSIEAQTHECRLFAERQGWVVHKIYVDEARSGTSDDRVSFQEMIHDALSSNPPFKIVLVHKLDRFARNRYDSIKYKHILRKKGLRVISAGQPILGSGDPTEVLLEAMLEGMDEFYSLNLSRESLKGMAENARQGYWNGGYAPYGYKFTFIQTPKGQKRKLMIEDSEAKAVRLIFKMYLNGLGASKIRNELNALGFKTRSNHLFNRNIILGILRNDKYMGDITFGKHLNKKKRPIEVRMDAVTIKDVHEPLVSREEFAKVQTLLDNYRPTENNPRSVASDFLFTSLIECSVCGSHFVGKSCINRQGIRYRYYLCSALDRMGAKGCTQRKFNADDLEPLLVEKLRDHLTRREIIKEIVEKYNRDLAKTKGTATKDISRIEREIVSLQRKRTKLFEILEDDAGLGKDDIAPRIKELNGQIADKELYIQDLRIKAASKPIDFTEAVIEDWVKLYDDLFNDETFFAKKALIQSLVVSVKIDERYAYLTYVPAFWNDKDIIDLGGDSKNGGSGGNPEPPPAPISPGGERFAPNVLPET